MVTLHAVSYDLVDRATVLVRKYFQWANSVRQDPDVEDFQYTKDNEGQIYVEPKWMIEELRPSFKYNERLSVRSAFDVLKTACDAGGIRILREACSVLSLARKGLQAIFDLRFSNAARVSALSEKGGAFWLVDTFDGEWNNALQCDVPV